MNAMHQQALPTTIPEYLAQLRAALAGADPALVQDALYDAEEYLRSELAEQPGRSEAEVIASANSSRYGLAAYLFTRDHDRICRITNALRTGMIAVNCVKMTGHPIPFGGVRSSGLGREGGRHAIEEFTDLKYVCAAFQAA